MRRPSLGAVHVALVIALLLLALLLILYFYYWPTIELERSSRPSAAMARMIANCSV